MKKLRYYFVTIPIVMILGMVVFSAAEQGLAVAFTNTAQIVAKQSVTSEISLTVANASLTMTPPIPGLTGGIGATSTTVTVITNNNTGFNVTVVASGTVGYGALKGETQGSSFGDYPVATPQPWVSPAPGAASRFGFGITKSGTSNTAENYSGAACNAADSCWARLSTTTAIEIVNVASETTIAGDTFTLKFQAQIPAMSNPLLPEDTYAATTTVTALMN